MKELSKKFNPYRNEKCFEYALENIEDFEDQLIKADLDNALDYINESLNDYLSFNLTACTTDKGRKIAYKHFEDLQFEVYDDENSCYGIHRYSTGDYVEGKGFLIDRYFYAPEIEIQLDDGTCTYLVPFELQLPIYARPDWEL